MRVYNLWLAKESIAISLFVFSLFLFFSSVAPNHCGAVGSWCSGALNNLWGNAQFFIPLSLIAFSFSIFCEDSACLFRGLCFLTLVLCVDSLASLFWTHDFGLIGLVISAFLKRVGGALGATLFLLMLMALSIQYLFSFSWKSIFNILKAKYDFQMPFEVVRPVVSSYDPYMDRSLGFIPKKIEPMRQSSLMGRNTARDIELCLEGFDIQNVRVVDQIKGPVVTRFFLSLPLGVRSNKIANLDKDIARSLSLASCRVVENIAGRSEIALELPNENREIVTFNSVYLSPEFQQSKFPLALILGKDTSGASVIANLVDMPHLLVAGTTGSGKSICLLSMIVGLILKNTPQSLKLILIDPKILEFSCFDNSPHLLLPVITDMNKATDSLLWCVAEMKRRYHILKENNVKDIDVYNSKNKSDLLPRIAIFIDEFSDLFLTNPDVENLIVRIAQKARTAGIHLVIATQRPCSEVITGLIKANIPARIALKTTSKINSNIVLDQSGSELLLGNGDMLVGEGDTFNRVHGAYIEHDELLEFILKIKKQFGLPNYIELNSDETKKEVQKKDDKFDEAIELILREKRASVRLFILRLKISHTRASRLIEQLESEGYVSAPNEENMRGVLI